MDKLIDAIEIELDKEKRRPMWHRIQEIYAEELPVTAALFARRPVHHPQMADRHRTDRPPIFVRVLGRDLARAVSQAGP